MEFQRNTVQRRVILEELRKLTSHPTAADLYAIVQQRLPRISLGTVYANLELLTKAGIIRKLLTTGKESRFDPQTHDHFHIRCSQCGRVDDLVDRPGIRRGEGRAEPEGWEVFHQMIEYIGRCPDCRGAQLSSIAGHNKAKTENSKPEYRSEA